MKFSDIVQMALSSLWQQRGRTLLSLVGVVVGSSILIFSLAAQVGVKQAVVRVFSESKEMRMIGIWPQYHTPEAKIPAAEIEPVASLPEEKRKRIRQMLVQRWQEEHQQQRVGISRERLAELKAVEHVAQVVPEIGNMGWAMRDDQGSQVFFAGVPMSDDVLKERLVSGVVPPDDDEGVLIHEFLAYLWGAKSDAEIAKLVGQKMRLEIRFRAEAIAHSLAFRSGSEMKLQPDEVRSLNRALDRIPKLVDGLPIPDDERTVLRKVFPPEEAHETPKDRIVSHEFVIRGVYRGTNPEEERWGSGYSHFLRNATVLVPIKSATNLYYDHLDDNRYGLMEATVIVDDEMHLEEVTKRMRELGYHEQSLIRLVERIHNYVTNVTWVFAVVAAVALFVAAVGIANTMILGVVERTHEIGVMKATGAKDRHVLLIFLIEGALVGVIGAVAALAISRGIAVGIEYAIRWIMSREIGRSFDQQNMLDFTWWLCALVLLFSTLVTMLAALVPARRAARINPVAALRHE